jgi:hypothetical protein
VEFLMALFDFVAHVSRYALRPWKIARVGRRMSQTFAQQFVLNLDGKKTHGAVVGRTNTVRNHWARRLKELATRNLWFPHSRALDPYAADFDLKNFALSFQRCLFCRPSYLYFHWKKEKVFRPCHRSYFCPFCFARISQAQYVSVRHKVRQIGKHNAKTKLIVTCRVTSRVLLAPGFDAVFGCSHEQVGQYERLLWGELRRERSLYQRCTKALNRKTLGSMWRIAVVPTDTGWIIETRQFLLHYPKTKLPLVRPHGGRVTYLRSIKIADCYDSPDTDFYFMLGQFNRYPIELLTGYAELTAAYLRAVDGMHTVSGTGVFRRVGRSLLEQFKARREHVTEAEEKTDTTQATSIESAMAAET